MKKKSFEDYFINKKNQRHCKKIFSKIIDVGMNFKISKGHKKEVVNYKEQKRISKDLLEKIPKNSKSLSKVIEEFEKKVVDGSMNFSSPHFLAFPDCGNSIAAMCGHISSGMLNQNLINSIHCSPTATFVELTVINWLREIVGYKVIKKPKDVIDVGGINVTGGVLANTVGLLLARENKFPGTIHTGLRYNPKHIKVFIPRGIGHYSIKAGLGWLGLGDENLVEVNVTRYFIMDQRDLKKKISQYKKDPKNILLALIAYTGDSRTMAIDDFPSLYKIAKKNGMWFHIDACHGLSLCFSDKLKKKVKGINLADSVTIDPHKVLFVPYNLSYVLVKDPKKFALVAGVSDLITKENYSFGQITPFLGSRGFDSLKLWFLIKNLGKEKIGKLMEKRHEMAKYFASLIKATRDLYLMNIVDINSVVYIYVPQELTKELFGRNSEEAIKKINKLNLQIQKRIFKEGHFYIHTFQLNDFKNVLKTGTNTIFQVQRLMLGNPLTTKKDFQDLVRYFKRISKEEYTKLKMEEENDK